MLTSTVHVRYSSSRVPVRHPGMQKLEIRLLRTLRNTKHRLLVVSFKCKGESAVNPIIVLVHI